MKNSLKIILYIVAIVVVVGVGYTLSKNIKNKNTQQVVCTQEVKQCPDGSTVSRKAPSCEFDPCPAIATSTEEVATTTKTFVDVKQKVSFSYPDNFYINGNLTEYVLPVEWPPQIHVNTGAFTCKQGGSEVMQGGVTKRKYINGKSYCVTTLSEGAAGSVYTTYAYKLYMEKKNVTLSFVIRTPQCANYDDPNKTNCEKEKKEFNVDEMVDKIFETVNFQ